MTDPLSASVSIPLSPLHQAPVSMDHHLPDDADVLSAVMAFLDNDSDDASFPFGFQTRSPSPPVSETESKSSKSSRQGPKVINRSRMRRRHELLSLKEQAAALQARLDAIHKGEHANETEEETALRRVKLAAWQSVAEDQKMQLAEAEQERDRLRQQLRDQKLAIKRVEKFFKKLTLPETDWLNGSDDEVEEVLPNSELALADAAGFEEISAHLPTMYLQINGVFSDPRLDTIVGGLRDVKVQNDQTPHMSVESLASRVLPFDVPTVAKAVWHFHKIKASKVVEEVDEELEESSEDVFRRTFKARLKLASKRFVARGRMETRRYVEKHRVVIVQCAVFDQTDLNPDSLGELSEFGVRQFYWTVIGPPRNPRMRNCGKAVSQIETFEVAIPFRYEKSTHIDPTEAQESIKKFCIEVAHTLLEMEQQSIEDILMNLSISGKA